MIWRRLALSSSGVGGGRSNIACSLISKPFSLLAGRLEAVNSQ